MQMALGCQSSGAASVLALEGSTCREYFFHANDLEPSTIVNEVFTEQETAISSSDHIHKHQHSSSSASSSSEESHHSSVTGVSSTTVRSSSVPENATAISAKKTLADSSGNIQPPWTCEALRSVSVAPTKSLIERRRLDSCSSTGSASTLLDVGDELTCIASGGPAGGYGWCAVGTVHGGVALIDRYALEKEEIHSTLSPSSPSASYAFTFDGGVGAEDAVFPLRVSIVIHFKIKLLRFYASELQEGYAIL